MVQIRIWVQTDSIVMLPILEPLACSIVENKIYVRTTSCGSNISDFIAEVISGHWISEWKRVREMRYSLVLFRYWQRFHHYLRQYRSRKLNLPKVILFFENLFHDTCTRVSPALEGSKPRTRRKKICFTILESCAGLRSVEGSSWKISSRRAVRARRPESVPRVARTEELRAVGGIDRRVCVRRSLSAFLPCEAGV